MVQSICIPEPLRAPSGSGRASLADIQISLVAGRSLLPVHLAIWRELQNANPELANPCFSPEFTQAVATVRTDVEVALVEQGREVVAIFPFQRRPGSRGIPVGGIVSDYHGLICRPDFSLDPRQLLKGCKLASWDFDRLLSTQQCFAPCHKLCEPSALIDLSDGFAAYAAERKAAGTRQLDQCRYMLRRLQREIGPVRFVDHSCDPALLNRVLQWKSDQYRRSKWPDLFAKRWGHRLAQRVHAIQKSDFAGMLSLLYAGSWLVAGHLGMRSNSVWHYWFPAYDRHFAKYSPGLLLLFKMAQHAEELGLRTIDVGTGITLYKQRLMNASVSVAEGSIERRSCLWLLRSARRRLASCVKLVRRG